MDDAGAQAVKAAPSGGLTAGLDRLRSAGEEGLGGYALARCELMFDTVSVVAQLSNEEIERRRRSIAMLTTGDRQD